MKWGTHRQSSLDPKREKGTWSTKNSQMTTAQYPHASSLMDYSMDRGNGYNEDNFSFMAKDDYNTLTKGVQSYLEKNEPLMAKADSVLGKMSSGDKKEIAARLQDYRDTGSSNHIYAQQSIDKLNAKYGTDVEPVYKLLSGIHGVYDSLSKSDKIQPMGSAPEIMKYKTRRDYDRSSDSGRESMEPFKPQDGDKLQKPRVLPVEDHNAAPRGTGKMNPKGYGASKKEKI